MRSLGKLQLDKSPNPEEADLILGSFLMKGPHLLYSPPWSMSERTSLVQSPWELKIMPVH